MEYKLLLLLSIDILNRGRHLPAQGLTRTRTNPVVPAGSTNPVTDAEPQPGAETTAPPRGAIRHPQRPGAWKSFSLTVRRTPPAC